MLHKDPKFLSKKYSHSLQNKLREAEITLNLMFKANRVKDAIPKLHYLLNKLEFLMIAFGIAITFVNKEIGYTHICGIIGRKIIQYIYINESLKNELIKNSYNFYDFIKFIDLKDVDILKLGDFFLDILMHFPTDIFIKTFDMKEGFLKHEPAQLEINPIFF
jgi:hypothetical protein